MNIQNIQNEMLFFPVFFRYLANTHNSKTNFLSYKSWRRRVCLAAPQNTPLNQPIKTYTKIPNVSQRHAYTFMYVNIQNEYVGRNYGIELKMLFFPVFFRYLANTLTVALLGTCGHDVFSTLLLKQEGQFIAYQPQKPIQTHLIVNTEYKH